VGKERERRGWEEYTKASTERPLSSGAGQFISPLGEPAPVRWVDSCVGGCGVDPPPWAVVRGNDKVRFTRSAA
jgi:hypothetical protein